MKQLYSKLIKDFLENLDVKQNSKASYSFSLNQFSKWLVFAGRNVKDLKRSDILEYKASLIREKKSDNTIDSYLSVVRMFFEWLEAIGEHENIAAGIKMRNKRTGYRKGHLNTDEIALLYQAIDKSTIIGLRDYAIVNLMLRSGVRCVEVSRLRVCDITSNRNECSILLQRKGDNDRTERIGITTKTLGPIREYLDYRGVSDREDAVFVSHCSTGEHSLSSKGIGHIVTGYMKKAGIYSKQKTPHSLRHTVAVQAIMNKVPIKEVQIMLGHRRIETTEIYLKSVDDEMRLSNPAARVLDDVY